MGTAIDLGPVNTDTARGEQRLYRLDPPLTEEAWAWLSSEGEAAQHHEYVVVSAVVAYMSGPETYIFPADSNGKITSYSELDGSFRGDLDHVQALTNAGYTVVSPAVPTYTEDAGQ